MAKNKNSDKSKSISKEFFLSLELITPDNIWSFFDYNTLFFIIKKIPNKILVLNNFPIRPLHTIGSKYYFHFLWDNDILRSIISIRSPTESKESYDSAIEEIKVIIRAEIKNNSMYAKRI